MTIRVDVTSEDLDKQIRLLELGDRILDKHFERAMHRAVERTFAIIEPNIPTRTGKAAGSFKKDVVGFGKTLTGLVGWYGKVPAWYINIVEHGARKHSLVGKGASQKSRARREEKLNRRIERNLKMKTAHVNINGRWVTMSIHPGFSKRGFMAAGFSAAQPQVNTEMKQAADAALAEQVVR